MDKKTIEQNIVSKKTDEGYYVEVFNDGKLVWTDTFKTEEELNWFIGCCNNAKELGLVNVSQDEARKLLENNELGVWVFYREFWGHRFAKIYNLDLLFPEDNKHGFEVQFVNRDGDADAKNVPTIDEAIQVLKDAENGKI